MCEGVGVRVGVLVNAGVFVEVLVGVCVTVGVAVALVVTFPPPKSYRIALPALINHSPMDPPVVELCKFHSLVSADPINVPFL